MQDFDGWLAAMPVPDVRRQIAKLEQGIAELERQADVLRVLLAQHPGDGPKPQRAPARTTRSGTTEIIRRGRDARRRSPQRDAILGVLRERPHGASPQEIATLLDKDDTNSVGTNLSRMAKTGMVIRVSTGLYKLPPTTSTEAAPFTLAGMERSGSDEE